MDSLLQSLHLIFDFSSIICIIGGTFLKKQSCACGLASYTSPSWNQKLKKNGMVLPRKVIALSKLHNIKIRLCIHLFSQFIIKWYILIQYLWIIVCRWTIFFIIVLLTALVFCFIFLLLLLLFHR